MDKDYNSDHSIAILRLTQELFPDDVLTASIYLCIVLLALVKSNSDAVKILNAVMEVNDFDLARSITGSIH